MKQEQITLTTIMNSRRFRSMMQRLKRKIDNIQAIFLCGGIVNRGFSENDIDIILLLEPWKNLGRIYDYSDKTTFRHLKIDAFPRDYEMLKSQQWISKRKDGDLGVIKIA